MSLSAEHGKMLIVMKETQLPLVQVWNLEIIGRYPITDKPISEGGARQNNRTLMKENVIIDNMGSCFRRVEKSKTIIR